MITCHFNHNNPQESRWFTEDYWDLYLNVYLDPKTMDLYAKLHYQHFEEDGEVIVSERINVNYIVHLEICGDLYPIDGIVTYNETEILTELSLNNLINLNWCQPVPRTMLGDRPSPRYFDTDEFLRTSTSTAWQRVGF